MDIFEKTIQERTNRGYRISVVPVTASTNRDLREMAASGAPEGTILFARTHLYLNEERELIIAITAENGETQVIFCPPQYEKVLQIGDTVLCHSALPYPAHMSNPTKCICMHCGTMQASENTSCIHCGATVYSVYSLHGKE